MTTPAQTEGVTLYYREGSHDKIYQATLQPQGDGFIVSFAFGRRGSTLQTGTKTPVPVAYAQAKKAFDNLVKSKLAKGYTPGEDGTPYQHTDNQPRATGVLPQLLNPIDEDAAQKLLTDDAWWIQEKLDGRRVLLRRSDDQVIGINRRGLVIALPQDIASAALKIGSQQWLMDGECVGERFFAFDLLESACADLRNEPYLQRLNTLNRLVPAHRGSICGIPTAATTRSKRLLLQRLRDQKKEGVVFKRQDALYIPGRPASGGDQLKHKFYATASCLVAGGNGTRRSVGLELLDGDRRVGVGNVSIPPNTAIPAAGEIIEIKYLYAYEGGSLYQPVYLGRREDLTQEACGIGQLKFKAVDEDEGES